MSKFFVVWGNPGSGKSTVALNFSLAIREFGFDVLLVDGDVRSPKIGSFVGVPFPQRTLQMVLKGQCDVSSSVYVMPSGLKVVLGSLAESFDRHPSVLKDEFSKLADIVIVDSSSFDVRWLDCGDVVFVSQDDFPSVMDVRRCSKGVNFAGVVLNRVMGDGFGLSSSNVEEFLGMPILGSIVFEPLLRECLVKGFAVFELYPESVLSVSFRSLAARLMNLEYEPSLKGRRFV